MSKCFGFALAGLLMASLCLAADKENPVVDIKGSNADQTLVKLAPANGVITNEKDWLKLAKAWSIKEPAKVDFDKQILVVGTTVGSIINLNPALDKKGDLKVVGMATMDLGEGFRFVIKSFPREGVKTIEGKAIPK